MGGSHAWIYSDSGLELLKQASTHARIAEGLNARMTSHEVLFSSMTRAFMYKIPLAVQTHPYTESASGWMTPHRRRMIELMRGHVDGRYLYSICTLTAFLGGCERIIGNTDLAR